MSVGVDHSSSPGHTSAQVNLVKDTWQDMVVSVTNAELNHNMTNK